MQTGPGQMSGQPTPSADGRAHTWARGQGSPREVQGRPGKQLKTLTSALPPQNKGDPSKVCLSPSSGKHSRSEWRPTRMEPRRPGRVSGSGDWVAGPGLSTCSSATKPPDTHPGKALKPLENVPGWSQVEKSRKDLVKGKLRPVVRVHLGPAPGCGSYGWGKRLATSQAPGALFASRSDMFYNQLQKLVSEALPLCSGIFPQLLWKAPPIPSWAGALVKGRTLSPTPEPLPPTPFPLLWGRCNLHQAGLCPHPKSDLRPPPWEAPMRPGGGAHRVPCGPLGAHLLLRT